MNLLFISAGLLCCALTVWSQDGPDNFSSSFRGSSGGSRGNSRGGSRGNSRGDRRGGGSSQTCSKVSREFTRESGRFLKCIERNIQDELDEVKKSDHTTSQMTSYISSEKRRYKKALDDNRCSSSSLDKDLQTFLKEDMRMSPVVYNELYYNLDKIIWEAAKAPALSHCFLDYLRDKFLEYIREETQSALPINNSEGLSSVPVPDARRYDLQKAKEAFDLRIRAYLLAFQCRRGGSSSGSEGAIKQMSEKYTRDTCKCAQRNFKDCAGVVRGENGMCGEVRRAILDIPRNAARIASASDIGARAKHCWENYKKSRDAGKVQLGDLAVYGIKLQTAFRKLTSKDKADFLEMIQGFLEAHFSTEFCSSNTCRY